MCVIFTPSLHPWCYFFSSFYISSSYSFWVGAIPLWSIPFSLWRVAGKGSTAKCIYMDAPHAHVHPFSDMVGMKAWWLRWSGLALTFAFQTDMKSHFQMQMPPRIAFRRQGLKGSIIKNFCCFLLDSSTALFLRLRVMGFWRAVAEPWKKTFSSLLIFEWRSEWTVINIFLYIARAVSKKWQRKQMAEALYRQLLLSLKVSPSHEKL